MNEAIKVEIQGGTGRRRIILAYLTENWPADLVDLSEEKKSVSDAEVEAFLRTITVDERQKAYRKYAPIFVANANAALKRLHPPKPPQYGRIASRGAVDFRSDEVSDTGRSVNPDDETPAERGNREARKLPTVSTASSLKTPATK